MTTRVFAPCWPLHQKALSPNFASTMQQLCRHQKAPGLQRLDSISYQPQYAPGHPRLEASLKRPFQKWFMLLTHHWHVTCRLRCSRPLQCQSVYRPPTRCQRPVQPALLERRVWEGQLFFSLQKSHQVFIPVTNKLLIASGLAQPIRLHFG